MKKILFGLVALSVVMGSSIAFADQRKPVEPQGAERAAQYKKVVELCRKFNGGYSAYNVIAHWGPHNGKTGWYCSL